MISLPKTITLLSLCLVGTSFAGIEDFEPEKKLNQKEITTLLENRKIQSKLLSRDQDELSADVQEMIEAQTDAKVIALLEQVEELMANVTDNLSISKTGKDTLYKENKIIEKIFEAAKEKSKSQGNGKPQQEMQKMLEQVEKSMKGEQPGDKPGEGPGEKPGDQAGNGDQGGTTDKENDKFQGDQGKSSIRKLPKKGGINAANLPSEYRKVIEAYNKKTK